jgi:hypothetical protein
LTRFIGTPDSVYSGRGGFLDQGILQGIITGNVAAGELCTLFESGIIKRTDPNLPWDAINQNTPYAVVITEQQVVQNLPFTNMTVTKAIGHSRLLVNDLYCVPLQTAAGMGFCLRSSTGLEVTNFIVAAGDTSITEAHCLPFSGGGFALIWHTSAFLKFQIFSAIGAPVGSAVVVSSVCYTGSLVPWHGHCQLANGNFALTWATTGGSIIGQIFSPLGVLVGTQIGIDTYSGAHHFCAPCSNGDFVVHAWDVTHTRYKLYRIASNGALVWGPIMPSAGGSLWSQPDAARMHHQEHRLFELPPDPFGNRNLAVMLPDTDGYGKAWVLSPSTGALIRKVDFGVAYHDPGVASPLCWTPAGFAIAHALSVQPNTYASFYDVSGNCLNQNVLVDSNGYVFPPASAPIINTYLKWCGAGLAITRYAFNQGYVEGRLIMCDHRGSVIGNPYAFQPYSSDDMCHPTPECYPDGRVFIAWFSVNVVLMKVTHHKIGRSSVIGVAQSAATDGQPVTIVSQGYFQLPSTQVFGPGNAFDQRLAAVPGCRGVVGGQRAALFGWTGPVGPAIVAAGGSQIQAVDQTYVQIVPIPPTTYLPPPGPPATPLPGGGYTYG